MHFMLCWCTQRTYETIASNLNVTIDQCQQSTHFCVAAEACKVRDKRECVFVCARLELKFTVQWRNSFKYTNWHDLLSNWS